MENENTVDITKPVFYNKETMEIENISIEGLQGREEEQAIREALKEVAPVLPRPSPKSTMGVLDAEGMDDDIDREVQWAEDAKDGYEGFRE